MSEFHSHMVEESAGVCTIGIDLGTTFSCVATFRSSTVQIITNEHSLPVTPSCVAFVDGERIVGKEARDNIYLRPDHTVFGVKRIVGRRFDDPVVQQYKSKWPFTIAESADGLPEIEVTETEHVNNETRTAVKRLSPEDISALVLDKIRTIAVEYLGNAVNVPLHAVITVPASFNDSQRKATKAAGEKAGLKVLAVVNEPTAAAVAYGLDMLNQTQTILLFDLGGGTLDVSILRVENGRKFTVLSTAGDPNLGGEDFDERLLQYCVSEFERKHNVIIDKKSAGVSRLRLKVEDAKKGLVTDTSKLVVSLDAFHGETHFREIITKARFDELCQDLFEKTMEPVDRALQRADLVKTDIDQVVLVGGCSRIPKIRELLTGQFPDQRINKDINADEAIAYGAAVLAHQLSTDITQLPTDLSIEFTDVSPYSLGTEVAGGLFVTIIPQNTAIPAALTREFTTEMDDQWWVSIPIYEGEERKAQDNRLLGKFRFGEYQRGPAGEPKIDVTFRYDRSGIVHVTAVDQRTGRSASVQVGRDAIVDDRDDDSDGLYEYGADTPSDDEERALENVENDEPLHRDNEPGLSTLGLLMMLRLVDRAERNANLTPVLTFPEPVAEFIGRFIERSGDRTVVHLSSIDKAFEGLLEAFASDRWVPSAPLKIHYQEGVDRGGVSRDVSQAAWEQAKEYRHGGVALFEGEPFKTITSQPVEDWLLRAVGKFLFACIVHGYAWPTWLDSSLFYYMVGECVPADSVAQVNSTVGDLVIAVDNSTAVTNFPGAIPELHQWMEYHNLQASTWKNKNKQEIKDEIAKFELYTRRKANILLVRDGFDQNNFLQVLRDASVVRSLMEVLCCSVQTASDFLSELEHPEYSEEDYEKEKITVAHFVKYIEDATVKERQDLMVFITGFVRIPLQKKIRIEFCDDNPYLPVAQTCAPLICFGIHYTEDSAGFGQFKTDLLKSIRESHHQFQNR